MKNNPEISDFLQSQTEQLKKSIFSVYKSIKTEPNQELDLSYQSSILKKYSLKVPPKKNFQSSFSKGYLTTEPTHNLSPLKKSSIKMHPLKVKQKQERNMLRKKDSKLLDLVGDPSLHGKLQNERVVFFRAIQGYSNRIKTLFETIGSEEYPFLLKCSLKDFKGAEQILIKFINYAIDVNFIDLLCCTLKVLGDFHLHCNQIQQAFYYFEETRRCAFICGMNKLLIKSLFQQATCCCRVNLYDEGIVFLKKALEYSWFFNEKNQQLTVYDELGRIYYLKGQSQKAKQYHRKFFSCECQRKSSANLLLSKQSLILEGIQSRKIIKDIDRVFLWMVKIPIKSCEQLPQFQISTQNIDEQTIRKSFKSQMKYFSTLKQIRKAIKDTLGLDFFNNIIDDPYSDHQSDWTLPDRHRKFISIDIQRNKILMAKGIPYQNYFSHHEKPKAHQIKQTKASDKRAKTEQGEEKQQLPRITQRLSKWYKGIADEAIRKNRNKNSDLHMRVQVRGLDKLNDPSLKDLRLVYQQFFYLHQNNK